MIYTQADDLPDCEECGDTGCDVCNPPAPEPGEHPRLRIYVTAAGDYRVLHRYTGQPAAGSDFATRAQAEEFMTSWYGYDGKYHTEAWPERDEVQT